MNDNNNNIKKKYETTSYEHMNIKEEEKENMRIKKNWKKI